MVWAVFGPQTLGDQIYNERAKGAQIINTLP
jgi:hypothetical protein